MRGFARQEDITVEKLRRNMAGGLLVVALAIEPAAARVCTVAVQDRLETGAPTEELDAAIQSELARAGIDAVGLHFQPAADLDHTARAAGCGFTLYTDVVRAGSRSADTLAAAVRNMFTSGPNKAEAELEFRLFAIDRVLPLISTSVTGTSSGRKLRPHVVSRVEFGDARMPSGQGSTATERAATSALMAAVEREVSLVRRALRAVERE
jgi:hypothetical protein